MSTENSNDNIERPPHVTTRLSSPQQPQSAASWFGESATKVAVALVTLAVAAFAGWAWDMNSQFNDVTIQLVKLTTKIDTLTEQLAAAKDTGADAMNMARDNARRIDRIENTRFTDNDAAKLIAPIEHRIDRLESGRR